jgi:hypothetical protein
MDDTDLPWEAPGSFRLDLEPFDGDLLLLLGSISMICDLMSLFTFWPSLVGLPLGLVIGTSAKHALDQIRRGILDPSDKEAVVIALIRARKGAGFSALCLLIAPFIRCLARCIFPS